jgi:hypothetical protein
LVDACHAHSQGFVPIIRDNLDPVWEICTGSDA